MSDPGRPTSADGLFQVLDCPVLGFIGVALLVMQPAQLLKYLGVVGGVVQNTLIGSLGAVELDEMSAAESTVHPRITAHVFLLLMDMTNLEPDVLLGEGARRRVHNVLEALGASQ